MRWFGQDKQQQQPPPPQPQPPSDMDDLETTIPLEANRLFFIEPHCRFTDVIRVYDITGSLTPAFATGDFAAEAKAYHNRCKQLPKDDQGCDRGDAYLTATKLEQKHHKQHRLIRINEHAAAAAAGTTTTTSTRTSSHRRHRSDHDRQQADGAWDAVEAKWRGGEYGYATEFRFRPDSAHCSHPLTLRRCSLFRYSEEFVCDSATFLWRRDKLLGRDAFTLWKRVGQARVAVGRFWHRFRVCESAGVLALDAGEVDDVVGILSCLVVVKRTRHAIDEV